MDSVDWSSCSDVSAISVVQDKKVYVAGGDSPVDDALVLNRQILYKYNIMVYMQFQCFITIFVQDTAEKLGLSLFCFFPPIFFFPAILF